MTLPKSFKVAPITGTGGFDDSVNTYWQSAANGVAPDGSDTMSRILVLSPRQTLESQSIQHLWCETGIIANDDGWEILWDTNHFEFSISDIGGIVRTITLTPSILPQVGTIYVLCCSCGPILDGAIFYMNCKGEDNTVPVGSSGYTAANKRLTMGARDDATENPANEWIICACLATDTYNTILSEMVADEVVIIDDLEQGRYIRTDQLSFTPEHYWDARDCDVSIPGDWIDRIGAVTVDKVGTTQQYGLAARF